ncbi:hypothetical protein [Kordiimonas aquimaris]|uniref:hypothetical protein n=1 Tax=Kordiimonas aquimaris TaxID=707591 RepID=UPI0021D36DDA|nr:hypothetical protein [Kordiimonas aquimaris]
MLKQISLSFIAITVIAVATASPAYTQQDSMEQRRLESQIMELKSEIRELKASTLEMQKILEAVAVAVLQDNAAAIIGASELTNCETRLYDLQARKDQLRTLGFSDKYPDMVNISAMMTEIQRECSALAASEPR